MTDGEKRLLAALVRQAISDVTSGDAQDREDALSWLRSASDPMLSALAPPGTTGQQLKPMLIKKLVTPKGAKRLSKVLDAEPVKTPVAKPVRIPGDTCGRPSLSSPCFLCRLQCSDALGSPEIHENPHHDQAM